MTFEPIRPAPPEPFTPAPPEPSPYPAETVPAAPAGAAPHVSPAGTEAYATPAGPASIGVAPVAPVTPKVVAKKSSSGGWLNVVLVIAAAIAIGGVAFAVGRSTAPASAVTGTGRFFNGAGAVPGASGNPGFVGNGEAVPGFGGGRIGGGLTIDGTVESITGDKLTIKTANGQTVEFTIGSSTTYDTKTPASASDVTPGSKVEVQLELGAGVRPGQGGQGGTTTGPVGTAGSVTVVP